VNDIMKVDIMGVDITEFRVKSRVLSFLGGFV
jgi:hypothetical protein